MALIYWPSEVILNEKYRFCSFVNMVTTGPVLEYWLATSAPTQKAAQEQSRRGPSGPTALKSARFHSTAASHNFLRSPECSSFPKSWLKEGGLEWLPWRQWRAGKCAEVAETHSRHVMLLEQSPGNNSTALRGRPQHKQLLQHLSSQRQRHNQAGMRRNAMLLPFLPAPSSSLLTGLIVRGRRGQSCGLG